MTRKRRIGVFVLETLTTGMYSNPLDSLREFVQNSADSIRAAEGAGVLQQGEGRIEVSIDPKKRLVSIRDNGLGIKQSEAEARLIDIGTSEKSVETDAGFRGIGRLAGIAYCRELEFRTSFRGEDTFTSVTIDCSGIRATISPANRQTAELADVMDHYTKVSTGTWESNDHYFEVIMRDVEDAGSVFLDFQALELYLGEVAPVEYDAQRFVFATKLNEFIRKNGIHIPHVTLVLKGPHLQRQVFKPYKGRYKTRQGDYDIDIQDIQFYPEQLEPGSMFWVWYSKSDLLGNIDDDRSAGLRLRKNNILLGGPERVADLFADIASSNRRFNAYYIGEIHVLSPEAIPNARRDGLELGGTWPEIKSMLRPFISDRCDDVRQASSVRNSPTVKIVRSASTVISDVNGRIARGLVSFEEKDELLNLITKQETKATQALASRSDEKEAKEIRKVVSQLASARKTLENENHFTLKKVRSSLNRKERKILETVLQLVHTTLTSDSCSKGEACFKSLSAAIMGEFGIQEGDSKS